MSSSSSSSFKWQHLLMMAGGAAAVGGALYYLFQDESSSADRSKAADGEGSGKEDRLKKKTFSEYTREDVLDILRDIGVSQEQMKVVMKDLTKELIARNLDFEETYERVKLVQPEDPLERHNISMQEFDRVLERYQDDANVRGAITSIMGAPSPSTSISSKAQDMKKETVIEIHQFMLKQLKKVVEQFKKLDKGNFEMKTVTISAQALVGAKVEEQFGLTSDDIESAVLLHHDSLTLDTEFGRINIQMQQTMSQLMGHQFPTGYF